MENIANENKTARSKKSRTDGYMVGKIHTILKRIKEAQKECGDRMRMLPVVKYERRLWFLDERLRQLRNVRNPHDFINLNEFEVEYFKDKVI